MPTKARLVFQGENRTKQAFNEINGSLGRMRGSVLSVGNSVRLLGGLLAGGFLARAGKESLDFADRIDKLNTRLGAGTEFLSQMRFAAEQTGVSFETLSLGLQRVQRRIAEAAQGTGEAKDALEELGLNADALVNLSLEDQFDIIAEAINGIGNNADKTRIAMRLFDTEGVALLQTMEGGAEAVRALRDEADRLGITLDQDAAAGAAAANDAINRIATSTRGVVQELAINFAPAIEAIANFLQVQVPRALQIAQAGFSAFAGVVGRAVGSVVGVLANFAEKVSAALAFFNAPGADSLQAAADKLRLFQTTLQGFSSDSLTTAANLFELGISVQEIGEKADASRESVQALQESVALDRQAGSDALIDVGALFEAGKQAASIQESIQNVSSSITDALVSGIVNAGSGMEDAFRSILANLAAQMARSALIQGLTNLGFGGLFKPEGKQAGGAVKGGRAYVVGETGPELFVPSSSGVIRANSMTQGTGGGTIALTQNIVAAPGMSPEEIAQSAAAQAMVAFRDARRRGQM